MTRDNHPPQPGERQGRQKARLAQALRENLKRRKQQAKARKAPGAADATPEDGGGHNSATVSA